MNVGACRIQGELPNRNTHAIRAKITEPQSAFTVGDHNHLYILGRPILQNFPYSASVSHRNENAAGATENVPKFLWILKRTSSTPFLNSPKSEFGTKYDQF